MSLPEGLPSSPVPNTRQLSVERDRAAQALSLHYAADHLGLDALEERLDRVYHSQTATSWRASCPICRRCRRMRWTPAAQ